MGYWDILRLSLATIDNPLLKCPTLRVDNLNDIWHLIRIRSEA